MSKQSKRIKPNQPSMIAMAPGQQPNMQQGQQQGGVPYDFTKVHIHFGIPCYGGSSLFPAY